MGLADARTEGGLSEPSRRSSGPLDAAALERVRRGAGLAIDRAGRLLHNGEPIRHGGVRQALLEGLTVDPLGEAIVRLQLADGSWQWAYVQCDGTPFVAEAARVSRGLLHLRLNTGERLELPLQGLDVQLAGDHDLTVAIHDRQHRARLGRAAWTAIADRLSWTDGRWMLDDDGPARGR